jgi:hypothetical protein
MLTQINQQNHEGKEWRQGRMQALAIGGLSPHKKIKNFFGSSIMYFFKPP